MVETITPVVHGGRARWTVAVALHVAGAGSTAALFGAALGGLGALFGAPFGGAGPAAVAVIGSAYLLGEVARGRLPVPQLRRQVPDWWRTFFPAPIAAFMYGAGLGVGFLTYLAHGTLVVVSALAFSTGRPLAGALIGAPFGIARGLSILKAAGVRTPEDGRRLVDALSRSSETGRRLANAAALAVLTAATLGAAWTMPRRSWAELAAAVLGVAFAWSAASKLAARGRWERALAGHRLPASVERAARRGVPLAEGVVPVATALGFTRIAAWWGVFLLVAFSLALLRVSLRAGVRVPCGCFGGRRVVDVRVALLRNLGVGAVAALAATAPTVPRFTWPGVPAPGEILPMMLASVGAAVAGWTAWRAAVWLGRAARA
jgi:hypothetical protein